MPTYEYRCRDCGRDFDRFQRMSDTPGATCPNCGGRAERLISGGAGLLFKGEGFYITDYRSEAYRESAKREAGATSGTESAAKSGAESGAAASAGSGSSGGAAKAAKAEGSSGGE